MDKEPNVYSFADECYVYYGDYKKDLKEKDKEIERLKKKLDCDLQWAKKYDELFEENNRLNNIIDELEKWLEQEYAIAKTNSIEEPNNPEWYIKLNERKNILDKLKKLKEGKE